MLYTGCAGPVGWFAAGAAGGAAANLTRQGLYNLTGKQQGFDVVSYSVETFMGGALGVVFGVGGKALARFVSPETPIGRFITRMFDSCFVAGTMVATSMGTRPIEDVQARTPIWTSMPMGMYEDCRTPQTAQYGMITPPPPLATAERRFYIWFAYLLYASALCVAGWRYWVWKTALRALPLGHPR